MTLAALCIIVAIWLAFDLGFSAGAWWAGNRKAEPLHDLHEAMRREYRDR